ncbi:hypothetical protein AV654_19830 [Paenibacillus elgii]|uniref:Uncharacterized protein n=1 Tax=Paenibacillus elgii TaxID=189691 RepID=A0A163XPF5_9BACL|nr:hypothetical protein [Paenibacillus elgii]KZE78226.1 hypothetical protein AV654_19830 [Paenibacillus elgii]
MPLMDSLFYTILEALSYRIQRGVKSLPYELQVSSYGRGLGVPKKLLHWWNRGGFQHFSKSKLYPFYLQKTIDESLETFVIVPVGTTDQFLWEYRQYENEGGRLRTIKVKRKIIQRDEALSFVNSGYAWTNQLKPPILYSFEKAKQGILEEDEEGLA